MTNFDARARTWDDDPQKVLRARRVADLDRPRRARRDIRRAAPRGDRRGVARAALTRADGER